MKFAITALYLTLALSLLVSGIFVYNHHSQQNGLELINPSIQEITESTQYYDARQRSQAAPGQLSSVMDCAECAKNAYDGFKNCPAAIDADGLDPWVDFNCIEALLKIPHSCKNCFCSICHHYHRRIRGC